MSKPLQNIVVIGGGAWGAGIASVLSANDELSVRCLARDEANCTALRSGYVPRLNDMALPMPLNAVSDPSCLSRADAIYLVVPAAATVQMLALIDAHARQDCPVIHCAKGLVDTPEHTGLLLPEYMAQYVPHRPYAMLSGPSFADEVIKGLPCALVASSHDEALCEGLISHFFASHMRLYKGADPIGVAVGGAVKNVIALGAGIAAGLGLGDNAKAALITRGLAETGRLIAGLGGDAQTLSGLAGIGDLTLTAAGPHSRNMAYGFALGSGAPLPSALAEGARTAPLLAHRARALGIQMPITQAVTKALQGDDLTQLITGLLARPTVTE